MPWVIVDWDKHFETSDSRKLKTLPWLKFRTRHDGQGYQRLIRKPRGVEMFGAFVLLAQVASKMPERGVLANEHGDLDAEDIGIMCGAPTELIAEAFKVLSEPKIGWVLWRSPGEGAKSPTLGAKSPGEVPESPGFKRTGQNITEQNRTPQGRVKFEPDCERFKAEYPKEISDYEMQIFLSEVRAQEQQDLLFKNLGLYRQTDQWAIRKVFPSAKNWLLEGRWKVPPKFGAANPMPQPQRAYRCGECGDTGKVVVMNEKDELEEKPCSKCGGKAAA